MLLDFQQVVAEIQHIEAPLLPQEHNDHTASPVQAISKALPETENTTLKSRWVFRNTSTGEV